MTIALCVYCATRKWGCWTACKACGEKPFGEDALAWSLILSDQFIDAGQIERAAGIMRRTGKWPQVDPRGIDKAYAMVRSQAKYFRRIKLMPPEGDAPPAPA